MVFYVLSPDIKCIKGTYIAFLLCYTWVHLSIPHLNGHRVTKWVDIVFFSLIFYSWSYISHQTVIDLYLYRWGILCAFVCGFISTFPDMYMIIYGNNIILSIEFLCISFTGKTELERWKKIEEEKSAVAVEKRAKKIWLIGARKTKQNEKELEKK